MNICNKQKWHLSTELLQQVFLLLDPDNVEDARQVCKYWQQIIGTHHFIRNYIALWCNKTKCSIKSTIYTNRGPRITYDDKTSIADCIAYMRNIGFNQEFKPIDLPNDLVFLKMVADTTSSITIPLNESGKLLSCGYATPGNVYTYDYRVRINQLGCYPATNGCLSLHMYTGIHADIDGPSIHLAESDWLQLYQNTLTFCTCTPIQVSPIKSVSYGMLNECNIAVIVTSFDNIGTMYLVPWTQNDATRVCNTQTIAYLDFNTFHNHLITIQHTHITVIYNPTTDFYPQQPLYPIRILIKHSNTTVMQ